jgi:hypothetical protein
MEQRERKTERKKERQSTKINRDQTTANTNCLK